MSDMPTLVIIIGTIYARHIATSHSLFMSNCVLLTPTVPI